MVGGWGTPQHPTVHGCYHSLVGVVLSFILAETGIDYLTSSWRNTGNWSTVLTSKSIYHQAQRTTIEPLIENKEMSEDGTLYFALGAVSNFTYLYDLLWFPFPYHHSFFTCLLSVKSRPQEWQGHGKHALTLFAAMVFLLLEDSPTHLTPPFARFSTICQCWHFLWI